MSDETGRDELARRLGRIFVSNADTGQPVSVEKLREFADDILAADYTDPAWGPRPGDGGPALVLADIDVGRLRLGLFALCPHADPHCQWDDFAQADVHTMLDHVSDAMLAARVVGP